MGKIQIHFTETFYGFRLLKGIIRHYEKVPTFQNFIL